MALELTVNAVAFGKDLKQLRLSRGLTLNMLVDLSGVSQPYLSNIENGKKGFPSPDTLRKLSRALEVPFIEMMIHAGHITESEVQEWISGSKN
jgi:transcriptional regulator with XRE-family HTH domain